MRNLTNREKEIVEGESQNPPPILDLPEDPIPITPDLEAWIILLPATIKQGLIQTINQMLSSINKITPLDLRLMSELRNSQNLYFSQKGDYYQREIGNVNELLTYLQTGLTIGGEDINGITPPLASQCVQLLKYSKDYPQHTYEWMDYEIRFNNYFINTKVNNDLTETDAKILKAWMRVLGEYEGDFVPSNLMTTNSVSEKKEEVADPKYANSPSPYKYNVATSIEKQKVRDIIIGVARSMGYPESRLLAHAWAESSFNPTARNPTSTAAGLGQFLKGTGYSFGLTPWPEGFFDPKTSSEAIVKMMTGLMRQANKWGATTDTDSWKFALGSYFEGSGYLVKDLIRLNYVSGSGMKFISSRRQFSWDDVSPNLTGKFATQTQQYVSKISKLALNPP
jgi:hypothetical protein